MMKRTEVISEICKRYGIDAAMASQTLSIALDNRQYRHRGELHAELDMYEELGKDDDYSELGQNGGLRNK